MNIELLKGEPYHGEHGLVGKATFVPYYIKIHNRKLFISNLPVDSDRLDFRFKEDRSRLAKLILELRNNKYQFVNMVPSRFKHPNDFLDYVSDNSFTFLIHGELFRKAKNFNDFHGNLMEESHCFNFRIFDLSLLYRIEKQVATMKQQYHFKREKVYVEK